MLDVKHGSRSVHNFTHQYAKSSEVIWRKAFGGGIVSDALLVVANIPLNPNDPNFDQAKVDDLETAAVMHSKSRGSVYDRIYFAQG